MRNRDFDYYYILQDRVPTLQAKIARLNEKLKSANAPLIEIGISTPEIRRAGSTVSDEYMSVVKVDISRAVEAPIGRLELLAQTKIDPTTQFMEHRTFTTLSKEEDEKIRKPVAPCFCDHCETNRMRIYIYTLKTPEGISRVGSGCLDSFAGFSMSKWQDAYASVVKAVEDASEITFTDAQEHAVIPVHIFIQEAIEQINKSGYQNGYSGGYSTGVDTFVALRAKLSDIESGSIKYAPETVKKATEIMEFIINSELNPVKRANDYYSNLRELLKFGHLTHRQAGLLASSIISHDKEMAQAKSVQSMQDIANNHYGTIGDKVFLKNLRVEGAYPKDTKFGTSTEITLYDDQGHMFRWYASGYHELKKDQLVNLSGKIVEHKTWHSNKFDKDMAQNTLKFCKFHTLEEIEELIATPPKVKKPRKAKEMDDSPAP